jgi:hypothetical protein
MPTPAAAETAETAGGFVSEWHGDCSRSEPGGQANMIRLTLALSLFLAITAVL